MENREFAKARALGSMLGIALEEVLSIPDAYRNLDAKGQKLFPTFSSQSVKLLLERNIAGISIDTPPPDCLDPDFMAHKLILGTGK